MNSILYDKDGIYLIKIGMVGLVKNYKIVLNFIFGLLDYSIYIYVGNIGIVL